MPRCSFLRPPFAVLLFTAARLAASAAEPPRPLTHEDLWLMPRVGEPVPSPDGRWVVVPVTEPAYQPDKTKSDLWIVPADGSAEPRRLTTANGAEVGADWSPDSQRLVFSAKRDGDAVNQLYVLDVAQGGEAWRLTTLSTGARRPTWSPDGTQVLFTSDVYPGAHDDAANAAAAKERQERPWKARGYDGFPIRSWDRWLDDRRAHLFVQAAQPGATARDLFAGAALAQRPGFGGRLGTSGETLPAAWSPDGRSVVFSASEDRDRAAFAEVTFGWFEVPVAGGEPRRLTEPGRSYGDPVFSPDGRWLVTTVTPDGTGHVYTLGRLTRFPWPFRAGEARVLTAGFDRDPSTPVFAADGRTLYFTAEDEGREKVYAVGLDGGDVRLDRDPSTGVLTHLRAGGTGAAFRLFSLWDEARRPPEVYSYDPATHQARRLTRFTAEKLAPLDLPAIEAFTFTSRRGRPIHNFLVRPAGFDPARRYPAIVVIHGGPHTMYRDQWVLRWNYHLLAGTEYVLVLTNYTGSTGFGEAFAQAIQGDPLRTPGEELNEALDAAIARHAFIDSRRVAAAGASYGGHLANWLQATTTRYRCLISHAGLVNLEAQWATSDIVYGRELVNGGPVWEQGEVWRTQNPQRLAGAHAAGTGWVTPMLITIGERDFRVPLNNSLENWTLHQRLQVPSRLIVFPDENHWILNGENSRYWYREVRDWWARWLR